jgi:HK97 family phage prohead protease
MVKKLFIKSNMEMKASKTEDRVIEFIASKEVVDRGGDVLKIKGMNLKNFKENPIILYGHDRGSLPIGKAISMRKTGDELRIKVEFAPAETYAFADTVYRLVKGNYLSATSVGIIPDYDSMEYPDGKKLNGKSIRRIINKSELFELSVVPVPMNEQALKVTKAFEEGIINENELKEFKTINDKDFNIEEDVELETKDLKEENIELKSKLAAMELLLKEQEMEAEEEDSIYKDLFDEFTEDKKIPDDSITELYKMFTDLDANIEKNLEHINEEDILNGYFE